jgi:hypothetical protein
VKRDWIYTAAWASVAAVKNSVVSDHPDYRKVRAGPARGAILHTSYRHGSRAIFGWYESEVARYVRRYLRTGDICYDIGAAGGYYAFAFARLAAPGRVYCFDIDERLTPQLELLVERNAHLGSTVSVHRMRLGALHLSGSETSLDHLVYAERWERPSVIKIDVDGGELDVLRGAERLLREQHPRLIVEVHSLSLEESCHRLLESVDYTPVLVKNRAYMAEYAFRRSHNRWLCAE